MTLVVDLFAGPALLVEPLPRGGKYPTDWTHKVCPGCRFIYERAEYRRQSRCRPCRKRAHQTPQRAVYRRQYYAANRDKALVHATKWKQNNRDRWLDANRKAKYGIPYGAYAAMLNQQGGGCAICAASPPEGKSLHVDHDHDTGQVRALLCDLCNRGLGYFADSPERLRAAAAYLEAHRDC